MSVLLEGLNEAQRSAVLHDGGPLLIVAGAGTGKTSVLTRRYVHQLHSKNLTTEQMLALTFTEKAAGEMEDRILRLLPNGSYDFWISTFHGFCQRILEKYALEIGLPTRFRLLTETDAWLLMKRQIDRLPLHQYRPLGNPLKFLGELYKHISRAKDEGVTPEAYLHFAETARLDGDAEFVTGERARLQELASCYAVYRQLLRDEGALDFGDLILETLRLLKESPRALHELRQQFRCILVDEFQDTNWAQYELVKLLAGGTESLTVVGDDDQAIYKFRGASLANILQFRDDFPQATTVMLTTNYRSHQEILDAAYSCITHNNPNRLEIKLQETGLSKKLLSARGEGGRVHTSWYPTLEDEADGVVRRILELKQEEPDLSWNDVAILSRSNDGADPFIQALERYQVPFRFYALRGLYAQPVIVDVVALLSLIDGKRDSPSTWRAMAAACYAFPASDLALLLEFASHKGKGMLWEALRSSSLISEANEHLIERSRRLVADVEYLADTAHREKPLKILQLLLDKTGYLATVMRLPERQKLDAINLLNAFSERMKRYEYTTHAPTLHGFLEELNLEIESGEEGALGLDPDEGPELVKVLTVHASKGLEFKHVFIVSLVDQRFPTRPRSESLPLPDGLVNERLPEGNTHLEEERRLFYVAVTRAKDSVTLSGASAYGGSRKKKPSIFFTEIGVDVPVSVEGRANPLELSGEELLETVLSEREAFPLKRRFSFTQLAAFRKCPLQYKFAHVYKIPILGSFQKSFGQSMHLTLEAIMALHLERGRSQQGDLFADPSSTSAEINGFRVSLEEAQRIFEKQWIDEWYESRTQQEEYRREGMRAIERLHARWSAAPPAVAFLEQPFDWRLGERSLKGAVDRIDQLSEGGYAIFDYKTGQVKTSEQLETSDKEQLWLYQLAMEAKGLPIRKLAYIYVRSGEEAEVEILQNEKRVAFQETIVERIEEILRSRFPSTPSPFVCRHCDFRHICEFRRL